jgi:NAD(P)-dependent dehydrogenase (short-subunit alcohol dehydrogenase family)
MDVATYDDWDWILGVNLGGIINVLVSFLPAMKSHGEGGHVVNVASMASFISGPNAGVYTTSKFAVRGLSESLRLNLAQYRIGVSLACPGLTNSNIYVAPRERSGQYATTGFPLDDAAIDRLREIHAVGMCADEVGRRILTGVRENRFYVFSHPEFREEVRELADAVMSAFAEEVCEPRRAAIEERRRSVYRESARRVEPLRDT